MGLVFLVAFFALLRSRLLPAARGALAFLAAIYRSGALVFGGGHVVLPLLQAAVVAPGFVSQSAFLAGYGAAQAMPGPALYLRRLSSARSRSAAGRRARRGVGADRDLPAGILVLIGALPFWHALRSRASARAAMAGVNAAVVGLLASALYDPVWTSAVRGRPISPSPRPGSPRSSSGARRRSPWSR